jgi:molybdate transport system substrate-binding protein
MSSLKVLGTIASGSPWVVLGKLYKPIRHDAVLLKPGEGNAAAQACLAHL